MISRPRQHRDRGLGHQARRLRLHREAVQGRPAGAGRRAGARSLAAASARIASCAQRAAASKHRRLIGRSVAMNQLRQTIDKVAPTNSRVLITGASGRRQGAGRARASTRRRAAPMARSSCINAAADHARAHGGRAVRHRGGDRQRRAQGRRARRGAWRHALHRRNRRHAARDAEQDPARAGRSDASSGSAARPVQVDVRIISSTSRDLAGGDRGRAASARTCSTGSRVVPIRVPALAERREDMPELVDYFMEQISVGHRPAAAADRRGRAWPCCSRMTGRATSASCATMSNG